MSVTMLFAVFSSAQMSVTMLFAVFSSTQMSVTVLIAVFPSVTMLFALFSSAQTSSAQMSVTVLFAVFSSAQMSVTMLFAVFSCAQMSVTVLFAVPRCPLPCYLRCFQAPRCPLPCYLRCFHAPRCPLPCYLRCFQAPRCPLPCCLRCFHAPRCPLPCYLRCFQTPRASAAYYVCTTKSRLSSHGSSGCPRRTTSVLQKSTFPTEAPGVPDVLHLYYKSRLSSHGSSGCPRRTTFVLQKSTFLPRKIRVSAAYYVCTTKVYFPATEAPGVPGVLRLYYKTRLSSHGSSACPYYKSRLWHRDHAETRRGVTFVCQKRQKHDGFGTAPTPKPAEGLRLYVKKGKNTMVLAPRQRRNPQRVVCAHEKKFQKRRF